MPNAKPTRTVKPITRAVPDSMQNQETISVPAPAPLPELVFEGGKLPSAKDAAADWAARSNEKLRKRRNKAR